MMNWTQISLPSLLLERRLSTRRPQLDLHLDLDPDPDLMA